MSQQFFFVNKFTQIRHKTSLITKNCHLEYVMAMFEIICVNLLTEK